MAYKNKWNVPFLFFSEIVLTYPTSGLTVAWQWPDSGQQWCDNGQTVAWQWPDHGLTVAWQWTTVAIQWPDSGPIVTRPWPDSGPTVAWQGPDSGLTVAWQWSYITWQWPDSSLTVAWQLPDSGLTVARKRPVQQQTFRSCSTGRSITMLHHKWQTVIDLNKCLFILHLLLRPWFLIGSHVSGNGEVEETDENNNKMMIPVTIICPTGK